MKGVLKDSSKGQLGCYGGSRDCGRWGKRIRDDGGKTVRLRGLDYVEWREEGLDAQRWGCDPHSRALKAWPSRQE